MRFSTYAAVALSVAATSTVSYVIPRADIDTSRPLHQTGSAAVARANVSSPHNDSTCASPPAGEFPERPGATDEGAGSGGNIPLPGAGADVSMNSPPSQRDVEDAFNALLRRELILELLPRKIGPAGKVITAIADGSSGLGGAYLGNDHVINVTRRDHHGMGGDSQTSGGQVDTTDDSMNNGAGADSSMHLPQSQREIVDLFDAMLRRSPLSTSILKGANVEDAADYFSTGIKDVGTVLQGPARNQNQTRRSVWDSPENFGL